MWSDSFRFALACNLILTIPFTVATAVPYPTTFANSTGITFPSAAGTTGCPTNCTRNNGPLGSITWTGRTITATVTAETLVYVVNKKNNSTRTETITNTEVDLKDYTPLPTTKTTSVVLQFGTTNRTEILTFPSILYTDYPSSYTFCGTLPTTTAGVVTCLKYPCTQNSPELDPFDSDSPVIAYPSHPPIPDTVQNISASYLALDPRGSTWDAVWSYDSDYDSLIRPLMPDMGAWNCAPNGLWAAPASVLNTALYLTATSTSTEAGDEAGATPAPKASPPKEVPAPAAGKEPAKVEPQAAELSQIIANPFGVGKPAEKPTPAPSPPAAVAPHQAASDDKAGSNPAAQNPAPANAESNPDTPPKQAANDNEAASPPPPPQDEANTPNPTITAVPAPGPNALAHILLTTINALGSTILSTTQVPGIIVTSTNALGSPFITTIPVISPPSPPPLQNPQAAAADAVVINGHTLTTDAHSNYILGSQTLTPNVPLLLLGSGSATTPVILHTNGANVNPALVIGSSTTTLDLDVPSTLSFPLSTPTTPIPTPAPTTATLQPLTIGTGTFTANAQDAYIVGGQTLTGGGEVVVAGSTVSLAVSTGGLGAFIAGGLSGGVGNGSEGGGGGVVPFLGGAEGRRRGGVGWMVGGVVLWVLWVS